MYPVETFHRLLWSILTLGFIHRHVDSVQKHPKVDVERVRNITYLHEFDRALQAPVWGYPTETAYYRDASSIDSLFAVKVPLFAIQAEDDAVGFCYPTVSMQSAKLTIVIN